MSTPSFVINLAKSHARKQFIQSQFSTLNQSLATPIAFTFFPAVDGKANPDFYLFKKYNAKKHFQRKGNQLTLAQLGCFASHYLLWEQCVALDQGIIVLEDDAILHPEFIDAYQFITSRDNHFEFFWLSPPAPAKRKQRSQLVFSLPNSQIALYRFYKSWANATGYYLTPQAAKKLLTQCEEWIYEVDTTMERYWENRLDFLGLMPFCLEPDLSQESNIPIPKAKKNIITKIRRECHNFKDNFNRYLFKIN